jgi:hypothetical protein
MTSCQLTRVLKKESNVKKTGRSLPPPPKLPKLPIFDHDTTPLPKEVSIYEKSDTPRLYDQGFEDTEYESCLCEKEDMPVIYDQVPPPLP